MNINQLIFEMKNDFKSCKLEECNEAPVLLITFNRPDNARKVFEQIKRAKVKKLYIANDAPRKGNLSDEKAREDIKQLITEVDWDCELHTNFQEKNLGCGYGPSTAISWAFETEDRLIILEDDCVPSMPFFRFCNDMLEKYFSNKQIYMVSGRSLHSSHCVFKDSDYIFSRYGQSWGWATWKRVWDKFDINMTGLKVYLDAGGFKNVFNTDAEVKFYNNLYNKLLHDDNLSSHVWDFQFVFLRFKDNSLSIVPKENLIHNIGYIGVHGSGDSSNYSYTLKASDSFTVEKYPSVIEVNLEYDEFHFNNHINKKKAPLLVRAIMKIFRILKISN